MTSDFKLAATGPEVPCDFPGCTLDAFHDGNHEFAHAKSAVYAHENDERLAALAGSYGLGTRSYNRSAGKRETDRQRAELAAKMERGEIKFKPFDVPLACACPQRDYPHDLSIHAELRAESYHPQRRFRWPWSLVLAERVEPSTERKAA